MFKRNLTYSIILVLLVSNLFAQKEKILNRPNFDERLIHYGFYLGVNQNDFKVGFNNTSQIPFDDLEVLTDVEVGFNIGLIGDLRLHKNINLRFEPGLISNSRTLTFSHISPDVPLGNTRVANNTYLHLPIIFKFSTDRLNNIRPYVLGGASYNFNFSSNSTNGDDNFSGQFRQNSSVLAYEVGIGIDIYLPYFKLSPSIRGLFAINDELIRDNPIPGRVSPYTDPIDFLGTRGVFLHLAFE